MQTFWSKIQRNTTRGTWVALLSLFTIGFFAATTFAQSTPSIVVSAPVSFYASGAWPTGGALSGGDPAGGTWGIDYTTGTIVASTTYGGEVIQFTNTAASGAPPVYVESLVGYYGSGNAGPVAIDPSGNLWVAGQYQDEIVKVAPSSTGTYTLPCDPTATSGANECTTAPPACTGNAATDAAAGVCQAMSSTTTYPLPLDGYFGTESMAFDSAGDLFVATNGAGGSAPESIFECPVGTVGAGNVPASNSSSCLYGTEEPTVLVTEGQTVDVYTGTSYATTGQLYVGSMAVDPAGNLFYTDSAVTLTNDSTGAYSDLYELAYYSTGTGDYGSIPSEYASTPTLITTDSVPGSIDSAADSAQQSDDVIASVAVWPPATPANSSSSNTNYTVYFGTTGETGGPSGGIFGVADSDGTAGNPYGIANAYGTKLIMPDGNGNFYIDGYNNGDTLGFVSVGSGVTDPTITGVGQATAFTANVSDSGDACTASPAPSLSFAVAGTNASDFDASATPPTAGTCAAQLFGSSFPVTVTFSPTKAATDTATLAVTDESTSATNSASPANLIGTAETAQKISITAAPVAPLTGPPYTYASGATLTLTVENSSSSNSGNDILLSVSGPGTLSATDLPSGTDTATLTVNAAGTIVVTANQAGSSTYAPALPTPLTITVAPIAQVISWSPPPPRSVAYPTTTSVTLSATGGLSGNGIVFAVDPSSTATASIGTLTTTTNSTTSVPTTTGTLTISSTGTVVIDATQAASSDGDYSAAPEVQTTIYVSGTATAPPGGENVVMSESTFLGALSGGETSASNPDGGTMAIDPNGNAIIGNTYGNGVVSFNPTTGAATTVGSTSDQTGDVAVDPVDNSLFIGNTYGDLVVKIPYNSSTGYGTYTSGGLSNCTGSDTSACLMANVTAGSTYILQSMAFDSAGDLFYGIQTDANYPGGAGTSGITDQGSIWECTAACLYSTTGSPAPVMLWQEPTSVTVPSGTYQGTAVVQVLGSLVVDSGGDLFFTDTAENETVGGTYLTDLFYSDLYELPYNAGTTPPAYAASPTTLVTEVAGGAPQEYPAEIDGVAIDPNNTGYVYFTDQAGTYEFANPAADQGTGATLSPSSVQTTMWTVSGMGGKYIAVNSGTNNGTGPVFYEGEYSGAVSKDSMYLLNIGSVNVPGTVSDTLSATVPSTTSFIGSSTTPVNAMYTVMNDGTNCASSPTVTFADTSNASNPSFSAETTPLTSTQTTNCSTSITDAAWLPTTLTFTPPSGTATGPVSETLTATDSSSNSGTATVTGTAQSAIGQTISGFTILNSSGTAATALVYDGVYTVSAMGGASGNAVVFSVDGSSSTGVTATITGSTTDTSTGVTTATLTITGVGTGSTSNLVLDLNQAGTTSCTSGCYSPATQVQETFAVGAAPQTITYAAPLATANSPTTAYSVTYTTTAIALSASATSALPVTFSVVSGPGTITGDNLSITGLGLIEIAADQAGNTDYAAATTADAYIDVTAIGAAPTPTFSPAAGSVYLNVDNTITITATGATIYYTTDGSTPTATPADLYSAPFTLSTAGSYTVNALAVEAGYTSTSASAAYTVGNLAPNFTASVSPSGVDLTPGSSATVDITLTPNAAFFGTVTFACSGAPSGVTCSFAPASLTATSSNTGELTTALTITDAGSTSSAKRRGPNPFIPGGATFALALCFFGFRKRRGLLLGLILVAGAFGLTQLVGCGSGGGVSTKGQTTTSMTVTATSTYAGTSLSYQVPVSITITQ